MDLEQTNHTVQPFCTTFNDNMKDFVSKHFLAVKGEYSLDVVLKELQKLAINAVCNGKDTLVSLPTGYGKTLIILLPPLLMDKVSFTDSFILLTLIVL